MRTRLNKNKQPKFIKGKTYLSVLIVLMTVGIFVTPLYFFNEWSKTLEVPQVYAQVAGKSAELAPPTLNPDLTEREQNIDLIKKIWGRDREIGLAIAKCESGYRTHAVGHNTNGTIDEGIFQANSVHGMPEMQVATANVAYAYTLFLKQGTTPWDSSKHCWGDQI